MTVDIRPSWQRWLAPNGSAWLVILSIAWFTAGLVGVIGSEASYGWRARPIDHAWHAVGYVAFMTWLVFGERLHRRGRR
jgi:hypothetical protein